tara:strand:- start:50 stop:283 length:234 start_codon:yes stop_codon:yes gene_type:complete
MINEMKSQNYLFYGAFLVLQYIFALAAHLNFPPLQQNNPFVQQSYFNGFIIATKRLNTRNMAVNKNIACIYSNNIIA